MRYLDVAFYRILRGKKENPLCISNSVMGFMIYNITTELILSKEYS